MTVILVAASCSSSSGDDAGPPFSEPDTQEPDLDQVRLDPVGEIPADPFVQASLDVVDSVPDQFEDWGERALGARPANPPDLTETVGAELSGQEASADEPGLYGGTKDEASCDAQALEDFLTDPANDDQAAAWADALEVEQDEIPDYLDSLTPVRLRLDTRVTNHGYSGGEAQPVQSVLQAGTAVFVDDRGAPRVMCSCGNPLDRPEPLAADVPDRTALDVEQIAVNPDDAWEWLEPRRVVVIVRTTVQIDVIVVYDLSRGELFERPAGSTGRQDQWAEPSQPPTTTVPTTDPPPTSRPDPPPAPAPTPPPTLPPVPAAADVGQCVEINGAFTELLAAGECQAGTSATYRVAAVVDILGTCPNPQQAFMSSGDFLLCLELNLYETYCYETRSAQGRSHVTAVDCGSETAWHVVAIIPGATGAQAESQCPSNVMWTHWWEFQAPQMLVCVNGNP